MLAVFLYHCTRFFDTEGWHLKNAEQSFVLFIVMRGLMWPWLMELFFLLSGVGAWYVLQSRSAGAFVVDRVKRLLIPLYTVGLLILMPPAVLLRADHERGVHGRLLAVDTVVFRGIRLSSPYGLAHGDIQSALRGASLVPEIPLSHFARDPSAPSLSEIAARSRAGSMRSGPLVRPPGRGLRVRCCRSRSRSSSSDRCFPVERGWAEFVWYAIYFVVGFLIPADGRFTDAFKRHGWASLPLWIVGFFGGIAVLVLGLGYDPAPGAEPFSL